ncbi:MAG: AraC family transcriptional regulator [Roseovarius sp.]|nr:AraC family transcriptional regulator [Roseovarius sp.]
MLDRYAFLDTTDFEMTRGVHQMLGVALEPAPKRARHAKIHTKANGFDSDAFSLFYFSYSEDVTVRIGNENAHHWLALPIINRPKSRPGLHNRDGQLYSQSCPDPLRLRARTKSLSFCLKQHTLDRYLTAYLGDDITAPFSFQRGFDLIHASHRAVGQIILMLIEDDAQDETAMTSESRITSFLDAITSTMLFYCPHTYSEHMRRATPAPAPRDVKRVLDYIHSFANTPVSLAQLVEIAGVPGRTLNQHFRAHTGLSPMAYLRRTRLRNAYRALHGGRVQSVTDVALACGIQHLGRFSQSYKSEFGELPSQTAARLH